MYINGDNNNSFSWLNNYTNDIKDSSKHSEELAKLFSKGQGIANKLNDLKGIKIQVIEHSLENNEKSFTLKIKGSLNTSNKKFVSEIAEKFGEILETYKDQKMSELSLEMDSVLNQMKNMFNSFTYAGSTNIVYSGNPTGVLKCNAVSSGNFTIGASPNQTGILNENLTVNSNVEWKKEE